MAMPDFDPLNELPSVHSSAFIAKSADLIGAVTVGEEASVWYSSVLRADINKIKIGARSNIQDGCIVHLESDLGTDVGQYVTVGHKAILHACRINDEVLVGMGAIVMDGVEIGSRSIIGAGSLVTMGTKIPPGSLVLGSPARVVRTLSDEEQGSVKGWAENYVLLSRRYLAAQIR
jgi:carbonic anhydrase/acetyltransferase-like protein (isoleucine patch superfamily)